MIRVIRHAARSLSGLCFATGLAAAVAAGPLAAEPQQILPETAEPPEAVEPYEVPEELRLAPREQEPEADRQQILGDLYNRLSHARDAESAELIAGAIEKLWARSGSDTVDLLMRRAVQLVADEDLDVALRILDSVVAIAPDYSEGWNQRATVHFLRKDYSSSLRDLRRVLGLDPQHFKAINGLGLIMQEIGDKKSALRAFREALKVHPFQDDARQAERELSREVEGQGI